MRLSQEIASFLKDGLLHLSDESRIYLFGSRIDDNAKGGDIDILWLTTERIPQQTIRKFKTGFYKKFGWRKIDIVNFTFTDNDKFKDIALQQVIEL